jgi:hypothetical protein
MATDLYKGVFYTDGEGADVADLNNMRGSGDARLLDQVLAHLAGGPLGGTQPDVDLYGAHGGDVPLGSSIPVAYTLTAGEAYLFADGTPGNELRVAPGTVFHKTAAKSGDAPTFLAYDIGAADFAFTIANGDATNPRIDLVQIRLELVTGDNESRIIQDPPPSVLQSVLSTPKKRRVQATCTVKAGTPAATPTFPAPDAGYVALGAIHVPATWTAAQGIMAAPALPTSLAGMMQLSVPMRVTPYVVFPKDFDYDSQAGGANWSLNAQGLSVATGAGTGLLVHPPVISGRLVGVSMGASFAGSSTVEFAGIGMDNTGTSGTNMATLTTDLAPIGAFQMRHATAPAIADADPGSNPVGAGSMVGAPCWMNGWRVPKRAFTVGDGSWTASGALRIAGGNGSLVGPVTFWVAG